MSDFIEIDPVTGIRSDFKWNENDQRYTIERVADVEPVLDFAKAMANDGGLNRADIKRGWWLYATIPPIVIVQMRAKGIDIFNQDHQARMLAEINSNYPMLKCTTGNWGGREKLIVG
jgi:hypothetical protein